MFGLSDSFTSWDVRRALTARGAGVGGWRSMDAKRVTAATARRRLEDSQQSACQTKPSSGRVYDGAPGGPALLSPCLSNQRAESSTTICCTVTWNGEWELRTNKRNKKSILRISPSLEFDFGLCVWLLMRERVTASNQPFLLCCSAREQIKWSDLVDLPRQGRWLPVCWRRMCWCVCCDDVKGVVAGSGYLVAGVSILSRPPTKWQTSDVVYNKRV